MPPPPQKNNSDIPSLKLTLPLKMASWNTILSCWDGLFSGSVVILIFQAWVWWANSGPMCSTANYGACAAAQDRKKKNGGFRESDHPPTKTWEQDDGTWLKMMTIQGAVLFCRRIKGGLMSWWVCCPVLLMCWELWLSFPAPIMLVTSYNFGGLKIGSKESCQVISFYLKNGGKLNKGNNWNTHHSKQINDKRHQLPNSPKTNEMSGYEGAREFLLGCRCLQVLGFGTLACRKRCQKGGWMRGWGGVFLGNLRMVTGNLKDS